VSSFVLALDFGHGGGRVLFLDIEDGSVYSGYQRWPGFVCAADSYGREFDPDEFFRIFTGLVRRTMSRHAIQPSDVVGISAASMRHSYVFLDRGGIELYAGPNTDARGLFYQDLIEEEVELDLYSLTGQWPPLIYMPARLLWFQGEDPERFERISTAMSTADWLLYRLTGEIATEPSLASSTMLLNVESGQWMPEVLDALGLNGIELPAVGRSGERMGVLGRDAARLTNLLPGTPVFVGGADTQLGLLACLATQPGDAAVVAGTSTPVMQVVSEPVMGRKQRLWVSRHVLSNRWVLESNAQIGGLVYEWLMNSLRELLERSAGETYELMESLASDVAPGCDGMSASLGPEVFNVEGLAIVRPAGITFPQPAHPMNSAPAGFGHLVRAVLENIACAVVANLEQVEQASGMAGHQLRVTGGLSRSRLWLDSLAGISGKELLVPAMREGTAVGCAICAAVGAGAYESLEEGAQVVVESAGTIEPNPNLRDAYGNCYRRWRQLYDTLAEA